MTRVYIYGNGGLVTPVYVTENSYINLNVMGDCTAYLEFFSPSALAIIPGCYCSIFGLTFYVRDQVIPTRDVNRLKYQIVVYGTVHELEKAIYFISDSTGESITPEVSWSCTPLEFLQQLVVNMNRVQPTAGWTVGGCITADEKTIDLSSSSCLQALQAAAELWGTQWAVKGRAISLQKIESENLLTLEVGENKGLRSLTANKANDSQVITRLYAYGSDTNSPTGQRLEIDPVDFPGAIEVIEGVKVFEEVFPQFLLTVTLVVTDIAFLLPILLTNPTGIDVNGYLIAGQTPQITFLTGECAGLSFSFVQVSYEGQIGYQITPRTLNDGTLIPFSTGYNIAPGDKFEIWNVVMPEYFVDEAKARLLDEAEQYLADHQQKTKLNLVCDDIYFRRNDITLELGNKITVISDVVPQLLTPGVEVQVIGIRRRIVKPWVYDSLTVGDIVLRETGVSSINRIIEKIVLKTVETGVDDKHFVYTQNIDSAEWYVTHGLQKRASVSVVGFDGKEKDAQVIHLSSNTILIKFSAPLTGIAFCN